MRWREFKDLSVKEITVRVSFWEGGSPEAEKDAKELICDVLDNVAFQYSGLREWTTDRFVGVVADKGWSKLATALGQALTAIMETKPLKGLPF